MSESSKESFNDKDHNLADDDASSASADKSRQEDDQLIASQDSEDIFSDFSDDELSGGVGDIEDDDVDGQDDDSGHKVKRLKKGRRSKIAQFIDDEAELSGDDVVSEDEAEESDDDQLDPELVDQEAKELDSDEEEEVRRLYHKQLESDDRRRLLLLQEQLEDNDIAVGQRRRRKFRWQTKEMMENSLKRHYDPDDDDSQEGLDDDDIDEVEFTEPRLRRPNSVLVASSMIKSRGVLGADEDDFDEGSNSFGLGTGSYSRSRINDAGPSLLSDDSNSVTVNSRLLAHPPASRSTCLVNTDMNRYLVRDKELAEALSTNRKALLTREDKERVIQRELLRVQQSASVFDQLYS